MYKEIKRCRISESKNLINILSLGKQSMTGVFPKSKNERVFKGPVDLVWCPDSGLLQMKQSYSLNEMYGDNYGYRSGLNQSMVRHLQNKIKFLETLISLNDDDIVIDIGSNDATSLKSYSGNHVKVGIDPTGKKFSKYYTDDITLIPDFFSEAVFKKKFHDRKAKIITSIAMFYDLEDPVSFVQQIYNCLENDGIWHFEQSYMPSMLRTNSYDTICHEHLEFYSLDVIKEILNKCDMKVIDVQMNSINGGSFAVTASKNNSIHKPNSAIISWLLKQEENMALNTIKPYEEFSKRVVEHRKNLLDLIYSINESGKTIFGYGASTKGNVLLQYCGLTSKEIPFIAEVNSEKFGCYTPGSLIPIISEEEAKKMNPDYYLVLPWHFKNNILEREKDFIARGGKFIFPLPEIEII